MSDGLLVPPCSEVALGPGEGVQLVRPQLGGGQQGPPPAGGGHHLLGYNMMITVVMILIITASLTSLS